MNGKSSPASLGWIVSIVTIILGALLLLSPSSVFRLHNIGNSVLTSASTLALPWAWLAPLDAIPLFWLLLAGWFIGLFATIGVVSRKRGPRRGGTEPSHDQQGSLTHATRHKSHVRSLTGVLAVVLVVLAISGVSVFLVPPTSSSHGQGGNGSGGPSGGPSGSLAGLSTNLSQVDQISDPKGLGYSGQRKMAVDTAGSIYFAYRKTPPGLSESEIYVSVSQDNGKTWTDLGGGPVAIVNAPPVLSGTTEGGGTGSDQRVPSIAIDSKNQVHVVWYGRDQVYNGPNERQIKYARWNGAAWFPWVNMSPVPGYSGNLYWQEHPVIVVDRNDVLHVLWEGSDSGSAGVQQIKHSMSTDGGITWISWENIFALDSSGQSRPDAVADRNRNLYVAWYGGVSGQTGTRIQYARWDAGSKSWGQAQIVAGIEGFNQKHVSLVIDKSNTLRLVWDGPDNNNSNSLVKYSSLNLNLSSPGWSAWTNIDPGTLLNQTDPTVSIGPAGIVLVGWQEWSGNDAVTASNASVLIMEMGVSQSRTPLGSKFSGNNKWPVMPEDSSGGIIRIGWLSGQGAPYTVCYGQTSLTVS